ncbi:MAG: alpha/beta fold hydrolase [Gallionellaceae bacterium]
MRAAGRLGFLAAILLLAYMGGCAYMWDTQKQHIYLPEKALQTTPDRDGMRYQEVRIQSGKGAEQGELFGWWIPGASKSAPALLYLHGNSRNVSLNVEHAARLHSMGYALLLVDYRGYGKSSGGEPDEKKIYEDAEAAWNYLVGQLRQPPQRTFIYGHSLGGAVAIDLAVRHPEAAGLITESTFTSMADMGKRDYPYLPVDLLLNQRFDSIDKVGKLKIPVLFIHGTWDSKAPWQMSRQLFDAAPQPKVLKLIQGGEHSNSGGIASVEYKEAVTAFVQQYAR